MNTKNNIEIIPVKLSEEYKEKFNSKHMNDFFKLKIDGEIKHNSIYRLGGFNSFDKVYNDKYFMLLKYTEAEYDDNITTNPKRKPHLKGTWCILNNKGEELKVFESEFLSPYLINNSPIYSIDSKYYNVETNEYYCYSSGTLQSSEYLFLENKFDEDKSKRGVMKINKNTGGVELYS